MSETIRITVANYAALPAASTMLNGRAKTLDDSAVYVSRNVSGRVVWLASTDPLAHDIGVAGGGAEFSGDYDDLTNKPAAGSEDLLGYKQYVALLTQTGTDAPVATVLKNTLGGTVVWGYTSTGIYTGTLASAFTADKTAAFIGNIGGIGADVVNFIQAVRTSANVVTVTTSFADIAAPSHGVADAVLSGTPIEIRVYSV